MHISVKFTYFIPLFCLVALVLSACDLFGGNPAPKLIKAPASKQIYTVPIVNSADLDTLDPALAHDTDSISAIQMLFTGLVQVNDNLQVIPQLAQSWHVANDGVTWTFTLRPNLKFSDGTALTSRDVAYSIDRALQPATQSSVAPLYLSTIKDATLLVQGKIKTILNDSLRTPDDKTIVIETQNRAAYFLPMLSTTCSYVVEKHLIDLYGEHFTDHLTEGGSSGPFKLAHYTHGQSLDFIPNTTYYHPRPLLQKVSFVFYHANDDAYQGYLNNKVDTTPIPASALEKARKRKDFVQNKLAWTNYYTMNYLEKPFNNIKIRQAFALAIDKTALASNIWHGTVIPTNHIVPFGSPGYAPDIKGPDETTSLKGNPTKALQLLQQGLQEEGLSGLPPITLTYANNVPNLTQEIELLVQMWQKNLHATVTPQAIDYGTLLDKVTATTNNANGLQFWELSWVGEYPDPYDWLSLQFGNGSQNNNMNYGQNTGRNAAQQQATQQLLQQADADVQGQDRIQRYQQAEQQLVNDVAWLPVAQVTATFLRNPFIVGIHDNAQGIIPPDDWASIYRVQVG